MTNITQTTLAKEFHTSTDNVSLILNRAGIKPAGKVGMQSRYNVDARAALVAHFAFPGRSGYNTRPKQTRTGRKVPKTMTMSAFDESTLEDGKIYDSEFVRQVMEYAHPSAVSNFMRTHAIKPSFTNSRGSMFFTAALVKELFAVRRKAIEAHRAAVMENIKKAHATQNQEKAAEARADAHDTARNVNIGPAWSTGIAGQAGQGAQSAQMDKVRERAGMGFAAPGEASPEMWARYPGNKRVLEALAKMSLEIKAIADRPLATGVPGPMGPPAPREPTETLPNTRFDRFASRQEAMNAAIQEVTKRVEKLMAITRTPPDIQALIDLMNGIDLTLAKAEASAASAARAGTVLAEEFVKENERTRQMIKGLNTRMDGLFDHLRNQDTLAKSGQDNLMKAVSGSR